jgi:hypothetical protein
MAADVVRVGGCFTRREDWTREKRGTRLEKHCNALYDRSFLDQPSDSASLCQIHLCSDVQWEVVE